MFCARLVLVFTKQRLFQWLNFFSYGNPAIKTVIVTTNIYYICRNILSENLSYEEAGSKLGEYLLSTVGIFGKAHFLRLTALRNWINLPDIIDEEKKYQVW